MPTRPEMGPFRRLVGRRLAATAAWLGCGGALLAAAACGNGADGVGVCRQIEEARCRRAPACSIAIEPPFHTSGDDVDACIRFYDVACLHGLDVAQPGAAAVDACVRAINTTCTTVQTPASDPSCAWLEPAVTTTVDAATVDAATPVDATSDATAASDATGD